MGRHRLRILVFFLLNTVNKLPYLPQNHLDNLWPASVAQSDACPTGDPVSILCKSISGRHRPVRIADGPMTARCRMLAG